MRITATLTALLLGTTAALATPGMTGCRSPDAVRAIAGCSDVIADSAATAADRSTAHALRGRAYGNQKRFDLGATDLNRAIEINPENAEAFSFRAALAINQGRYDQALPDLNAALSLAPSYVLALVNRGFVPFDRKDPALRAAGQVAGQVMVTGLVRPGLVEKPSSIVPDNDPAKNIFYWKDIRAMRETSRPRIRPT